MPKLKPTKLFNKWGRIRRGEESGAYKGSRAKKRSSRVRAIVKYVCDICESCSKPACDRHHKDGNTYNNEPENIAILCRRCHMLADGRLEKLHDRPYPKKNPQPCHICLQLAKPLRKGKCHKCNEYFRRNGREWTLEGANRTGRRKPDRPCTNCGRMVGVGWCKGRCAACRHYFAKHGRERIPKS